MENILNARGGPCSGNEQNLQDEDNGLDLSYARLTRLFSIRFLLRYHRHALHCNGKRRQRMVTTTPPIQTLGRILAPHHPLLVATAVKV